MEINKIVMEPTRVLLTDVRVPNLDDVKNYHLDSYYALKNELWWLSPSNSSVNSNTISNRFAYICGMVYTSTPYYKKLYGIRPLILFTNNATDKNKVFKGDEICIGKWLFKVIENGVAVCETVIGYSRYGDTMIKASTYNTSEIYNRITTWYQDIKSRTVCKVYKTPYDNSLINLDTTSVPSTEDISDSNNTILCNGYSYWLKNRTSEFKAAYLDSLGQKFSRSLTDVINVCPAVYFNTSHPDYNNFVPYDLFEINGRIFKFNEHRSKTGAIGIGFCMNTIGMSCYSTGICEKGSKEAEKEFYESSEVYEVIKDWKRTLFY